MLNKKILDMTILEWAYTILAALLAFPVIWLMACIVLSMGD